jgi:SAM-dependent methyltransferase
VSTALPHGAEPASAWVQRWSHLVAPGATLLDVACGAGRHLRWFAARGVHVTGVDRDAAALQGLAGTGELVVADIESGPWPFAGRRFDAIVVTNYLWRTLLPTLVASLADDGVLIYETFAIGNEAFGKPSNPNFLLQPGELLQATAGLQVVAYEHGFVPAPDRIVQRIVARRAPAKIAHLQGSITP